ncbi:hypothetical protein [Paenibacillus sp. CMAA1364]
MGAVTLRMKPLRRGQRSKVIYTSEYLFLCTGGNTGPNAEKNGPGYTLVQCQGHTLIDSVPAVVQLKLQYAKPISS